jgi:cyclopropane-fatty-acyl-phospholipid synthase
MFSLMLDSTMLYSCALFDRPESTLQEAQLRTLARVCEKLDLGRSDRVIEIGTRWGGFSVYAATTHGCHATASTTSPEQHRIISQRVRDAGVEHLVIVRLDEDRLSGRYDKLVCLEPIDVAGHRDIGGFFARCSRLLNPRGIMLLQAVTLGDRTYDVSKIASNFVRTHVAPNGCVPTPLAMARSVARRTDMRVVHLDDFTAHYAETLRRWRANVDAAGDELARLGYDQRFRRLWRAHLACWEACLEERRIALVQMVLAKPQHDDGAQRELRLAEPTGGVGT